jgi:hypothetical protein
MTDRLKRRRLAGYASIAIAPTITASGVCLWLFFDGAGSIFGPLNDVLVAVSLLLLGVPVVVIREMTSGWVGRWFGVVSLAALAGIALAAAGQLLLVAGVISLDMSFVTGSLGITPVLVWVVGLATVALRDGALPRQLGWASVALLASIVVITIGSVIGPALGILAITAAFLVVLVGWFVVLGRTCLQGTGDDATLLPVAPTG